MNFVMKHEFIDLNVLFWLKMALPSQHLKKVLLEQSLQPASPILIALL